MAIIALSSLPYLHEIITDEDGLRSWVPDVGIEGLLTDGQGKVWGFSSYRTFLYTLLIFIFSEIGWMLWLYLSKRKTYFLALFVPVLMGIYQILLMVFNLRKTAANAVEIKLLILFVLSAYFAIKFTKHNHFTPTIAFKWLLVIAAGTLPFFHDIITSRDTAELRNWVPVLGIERFLRDGGEYVAGFKAYRTFVYISMLHVYAHLGWLGAFIYYDLPIKKLRPFLLVPVIISLYSLVIILFDWQETDFNQPDTKFYITVAISVLLAINFFFNDKVKRHSNITNNVENL